MQSSWIYEVVDLFLQYEPSAAFLSADGDILYAKSALAFETPGFRSIVESSLKYISSKPGDVLITNDPYNGASYLHRYNFLLPLTAPSSASPGLVLCIRRDFSARLNPAEKLDEEGLRIPPTPIFQNGHMVTPIIEAMSLHPLCPENFSQWLEETVQDLKTYFKKWQTLEKNLNTSFSNSQIKKFLAFSHSFSMEKISEKAQGEGRSEVRLDTGETLKLRLEIQDGLVKADFGGTGPGFKIHVPDGVTFGACYDALAEAYDLHPFTNSGTFSILQVIKPLGCFLNAKYPASTHRGLQSGVAAVRLATHLALRQIIKTSQALSTESELRMEMVFSDSRRWLSQWTPKAGCELLSIENVEARYPVEFLMIEKNVEKAQLLAEFKILEPCQLRWHSDFTLHPARLPRTLKNPPIGTLQTCTQNQEWQTLPSQGSTDLVPGTQVKLQLWGQFEIAEKALEKN